MLALVAEDDRNHRTMIRRILEQLGCSSVETENGLELLSRIDEVEPDLVVVDYDMPLLNGFEALRALRSTAKYRTLPVVFVTGVSDPARLKELIGLGVTDIILKPIKVDQAGPRLREVLKRAARGRPRAGAPVATGKLLLVDSDENFLAFAQPLMSTAFEVVVAGSGIAAVQAYRSSSPPPNVVLVSEGLTLMTEDLLVDVLTRVARELECPPPHVYLLSDSGVLDRARRPIFNGSLAKTFFASQFLAAFRRVVLGASPPEERLADLLRGDLPPDLASAARSTIGALTGSDVFPVPADETTDWTLPIRAVVDLTEVSGAAVEYSILTNETSIAGLASKMLQREVTMENGAAEVVDEMVKTLAGRLRTSFLTRSIDLKMGSPSHFTDNPPKSPTEWETRTAYRSGNGERFIVGLRVKAGAGAPAAEIELPAAPAAVPDGAVA